MAGTKDQIDEGVKATASVDTAVRAATAGLPAEVARALTVARQVEAQARGGQRPIARVATGRLMAVLEEAGWPAAAMAPVVGLTPSAVTWRIRSARRAGLPPLGVTVPSPPERMPPRIDEKPWLTAGEAATLLGVHRTTLHRWRRDGLLPRAELTAGGGQWRYSRDDLRAILLRRRGRRILRPGRWPGGGEPRVLPVPAQLANQANRPGVADG